MSYDYHVLKLSHGLLERLNSLREEDEPIESVLERLTDFYEDPANRRSDIMADVALKAKELERWLLKHKKPHGELAAESGISQAEVSRLLYGSRLPRRTTADKILAVTGIDLLSRGQS